jgi:CubicO group peptidase (beta-lactamase class C family)
VQLSRKSISLSVLVLAALIFRTATSQSLPRTAWPVSTPEKLGLDASELAALDTDIAAGKYGNTDSMLVIRHGQIAYDRTYPHDYEKLYGEQARKTSALNPHDFGGPYNYFNPFWHPYYQRGELHTLQSVTKTVTSVVIGTAVARGEFPSIDTPVLQFFPEGKVANIDDRKRRMTIRHLLTMTAGFDWNESLPYNNPANNGSAMEASEDWVAYTMNRPMSDEPGVRFNYNSGATEILAHIFAKATGQDIEEYAAKSLFAPLGIGHYFWKRTPLGLADTEGGLYLDRRDLAKIAWLYLKNGVWEGKQIVSPAWVKESLTPSVIVSAATGVKYGFKWWLYPYSKEDPHLVFGGGGFGGQRPLVIPAYDLVMVFTGWNILGEKGLSAGEAIARVTAAVKDRNQP